MHESSSCLITHRDNALILDKREEEGMEELEVKRRLGKVRSIHFFKKPASQIKKVGPHVVELVKLPLNFENFPTCYADILSRFLFF